MTRPSKSWTESTRSASITGAGTTEIDSGALTAESIAQNVLTIGAGATLTIAPLAGGPLGGDLKPVPEPLTIVFLSTGLLSLLACRFYARKRLRSHRYNAPTDSDACRPASSMIRMVSRRCRLWRL